MRTAPLAVCLLAAGCGGDLSPGACEDGSCGTQSSWRATYDYSYKRHVDILLVVDDTSAIAPHVGALAAGLAGIGQQLSIQPSPNSSIHVGVVRAGGCDATTRGLACGVRSPEQFLRSEWCNTVPNFSGGMADAVACLGDLGASDCAPAQPLAAALQLLAGPARAGWEGFLRPDAYLQIIVVAAEDDASGPPGSLTPTLELAAAVKGLKPDPSQVLVSIIGPEDCAAGDVPGPRLIEFAQQFGANGLTIGLCSGQLPVVVDRVVTFPNIDIIPPCVQRVRDTDPAAPGLQANCVVEDTQMTAGGHRITSRLPGCDQSMPPCFRLTAPAHPLCGGYSFQIDRGADWCFEAGDAGTIECLSCADANDPACAVQP